MFDANGLVILAIGALLCFYGVRRASAETRTVDGMAAITIIGGHGKIALLLAPLLVARGDSVRSLIRNPEHSAEVATTGAEPVVFDIENATPTSSPRPCAAPTPSCSVRARAAAIRPEPMRSTATPRSPPSMPRRRGHPPVRDGVVSGCRPESRGTG